MKKLIKKLYYKFKIVTTSKPSAVLMLHSINAKEWDATKVNLSRGKFIELIDVVERFEHIETVVKGTPASVALSFDDGRSDIYSEIYPCLKERRIPFTIFITYNLLDTDGYLTRKQLLELADDELVTIGSHCMNHVPLAQQTEEVQYIEIIESKKMLEELLQKPVEYMAYPYGQHNQDTFKIIKENDAYKYAFRAGGLFLEKKEKSRYTLARMNMSNRYYDQNLNILKDMKKRTKR